MKSFSTQSAFVASEPNLIQMAYIINSSIYSEVLIFSYW